MGKSQDPTLLKFVDILKSNDKVIAVHTVKK
jgi:hypothetical protein